VLQESLGGNAKTCLIITASPSNYNEQETLSTSRFGERAIGIKNKQKINNEITVAELKAQVEKFENLLHGCVKITDQL
jgi:kinesin family protein 5